MVTLHINIWICALFHFPSYPSLCPVFIHIRILEHNCHLLGQMIRPSNPASYQEVPPLSPATVRVTDLGAAGALPSWSCSLCYHHLHLDLQSPSPLSGREGLLLHQPPPTAMAAHIKRGPHNASAGPTPVNTTCFPASCCSSTPVPTLLW